MELTDRIVAVTGGASGIGAALARRAARSGARHVAVIDLDATGAARVADEVGGSAHRVDVAVQHDLVAAIDAIEAEHGPIDVFCSNAGVFALGGEELPDAEWARVLDVNLWAHIWAARVLVPRMLARGGGALVQTASAAGLLTQIGSAPYAVSKHAAVAFAEWLAITHGDAGLRVVVVCPQAVRTAMTAGTDGWVAGLDGMLDPDDVADAAILALAEGRTLVLPHAEVAGYAQRRAADPDRWLAGMRRLQARLSNPA